MEWPDTRSDSPNECGGRRQRFRIERSPLRPEPQRFQFEGGIGTLPGDPGSSMAERYSEAAPAAMGEAVAAAFREAGINMGAEPQASAESLSELKPLGQVSSSFIVAVNGEGLWIIDQHVAHERVLSNNISARARRAAHRPAHADALMVELSPRQLVIFERIAEELTANGFEVGADGAAQRGHSGDSGGNRGRGCRAAVDGNSGRHRARERGDLHGFATSENCGIDVLPRGDQGEHAARRYENEMAAGGTGENGIADELPARRPIVLRYSVKEIERAFKRI